MFKKILSTTVSLAILGFFIYQNFFAFGSKVNFGGGEEVYYKSGATKADAQKVGETLKAVHFFDGVGDASVQVSKRESDYVVRFVTIDDAWTDPDNHRIFASIAWNLSQSAFSGANVIVELCDSSFEPQATVNMKESRLDESKSVKISATEIVYYTEAATEAEARRVGAVLQELEYFDGDGDAAVQVDKDENGYIVRFVTSETAWANPEMKKLFSQMAWLVSQQAFSGKSVTVELSDSFFETKATFKMEEPEGE